MFRLMKVFDCQLMPQKIRNILYEQYQKNNDSAITFYIDDYYGPEIKKINTWLKENGAEHSDKSVIILYWW